MHYILTGPTGAGKTELGLELAGRLGAEIVSMDSMALYRGMDIGTAKPSVEERRRVPHHLIDVLEPWESASVAWWLEQAKACCRDIVARGRSVLFVGGTPLYLKALLFGLFEGPAGDAELRLRLTREAETAGPQALHERLARIDTASAARLHPHDIRRVIRALEVWELTGRPLSAWQTQWHGAQDSPPDFLRDCQAFWLDLPRAELYARINARVLRMFAAGLVDEVRALRQRLPGREAAQALGYKEVFAFLDGQATLEDTVAQVQQRSRHFAKRQVTWFRHLPLCRPVPWDLTFTSWDMTIK